MNALQQLAKTKTIDFVEVDGETYPRERKILHTILQSKMWKSLIDNNACIAGGAITSMFSRSIINDVDIFHKTVQHYDSSTQCAKKVMSGERKQGTEGSSFETKNDLTFNSSIVDDGYGETYSFIHSDNKSPDMMSWTGGMQMSVQFVKPEIIKGDVKDVLMSFDFSVCMGAYDFSEDVWVFHPSFFADLATKRLRYYPNTLNPINSLLRVAKYQRKGFNISSIQMMKLVLAVADEYKTFGEAIRSMSFVNRDLKLLRSAVVRLEYENVPFTSENLIKLIEEDGKLDLV